MIHQFKLNGYNVVLDVASGAIHVVDDVAYDIIEQFETTPKEEILTRMKEKYLGVDDIPRRISSSAMSRSSPSAMRASSIPPTPSSPWQAS